MKRTSLEGNVCPVARSLDIIGDWWSLLIIRDAIGGLRRFGQFQRNLGMAKNILSARLKRMVEDGIMTIEPASDGSAFQEYVLTEKGKALLPVLIALGQWGNAYMFAPGEHCSIALDRKKRRPLRTLELKAEDGRTLEIDDIIVSQQLVT